jgi:hypothetical protein
MGVEANVCIDVCFILVTLTYALEKNVFSLGSMLISWKFVVSIPMACSKLRLYEK